MIQAEHFKGQSAPSAIDVGVLIIRPVIGIMCICFSHYHKYTKDYLDVDDYTGTCRAVCNDLAFIADLRAVEIKMMQYRGSYQMMRCMRNNGFNATHQFSQAEKLYKQFCQEFFADANFQRRMKLYIDTVQCYPELLPMIEEASVIPIEFKQYYRGLGAERIRRSGYVESILRKHLEDASKFSSVNITLEQEVSSIVNLL